MRERDEFIAFINRLKAVSPTITDEQRKGLLRQATQDHQISVTEASEILKASGLIVGEKENYFEVLGISFEELQNQNEDAIIARVDAAHKKLYSASLRAGGRPRADGRSEDQWRTLLNQARETLINPTKRQEHVTMLQSDKSNTFFEGRASPIFEHPDVDTTRQDLSYQIVPDDVDVPTDMIFIPAGEFRMGSNDDEANEDEQPVHTVFLEAFLMDKHPVTNSEFQKFINTNPQWHKPGLFQDHIPINYHDGAYLKDWQDNIYPASKGDHPVVHVSWFAAMAYAQWVGKRLPTEAEWEKAARGRLDGKKYPLGDTLDSDVSGSVYNLDDTTSVGLSPVNGYGLYDMSGNVWEWCLDAYDADFYVSSPHTNPFSGSNSVEWVVNNFRNVKVSRVLRGGPWDVDSQGARVSHRFRSNPADSLPTFGFRCVKDITS